MNALDRAAELIAGADDLLVCAGAGMGVDSGLPDFRGDHGFWRAYPPYERLGLGFAELADPTHFEDDPELAWGFYGHRLALYRSTAPHEGFAILARWGAARVFTSNVDGQFQRAGFAGVAEVHGSIHHLQCVRPCGREVWPASGVDVAVDPETMRAVGPLPSCPACGGLARPNILMFGDHAWLSARTDRQLAELSSWLRDREPVVIEIGAGTAVPTVRRFASRFPRLVRVNPREPEAPGGISLPMGALAALSELDSRVGPARR